MTIWFGIKYANLHIMSPSLFFAGPLSAARTSLTHRGMDPRTPLKMSCGIWHVSNRSLKSCKLQGRSSMDWSCLSRAFLRCLIWLRAGPPQTRCGVPQTVPEPFLLFGKSSGYPCRFFFHCLQCSMFQFWCSRTHCWSFRQWTGGISDNGSPWLCQWFITPT